MAKKKLSSSDSKNQTLFSSADDDSPVEVPEGSHVCYWYQDKKCTLKRCPNKESSHIVCPIKEYKIGR